MHKETFVETMDKEGDTLSQETIDAFAKFIKVQAAREGIDIGEHSEPEQLELDFGD